MQTLSMNFTTWLNVWDLGWGLFIYFVILSPILWAVISGILAHRKGRSVVGWIFISFLLGWIAIIILVCLPSLYIDDYHPIQKDSSEYIANLEYSGQIHSSWICPSCNTENSANDKLCSKCFKYRGTTPDRSVKNTKKVKRRKDGSLPISVFYDDYDKPWLCDCGAKNGASTTFCKACSQSRPKKIK